MKKYKISLILNVLIFLFVLFGTIIMMNGIKFMGDDIVLTESKIEAFKFFTVDSNVLMGLGAIVFAYFDYLVLSKKKKEIPKGVYLLKHIATVGVVLTFVVTAFYLAPFSDYSYFDFFKNSNLFFHLIVPVLSTIVYIFYEGNKQDKKAVFYGIIPMIIYAIYYIIVYLMNCNSNAPKDSYDWYGLISNDIFKSITSIFVMLALTYLISWALWYYNKKLSNKK